MKQKIFMMMAVFLIGIMALQFASAGLGYQNYIIFNGTSQITESYGRVQRVYSLNAYTTSLCFYSWCYTALVDNSDFLGNNPAQIYIQYGLDPIADWNSGNPLNEIDYCRITIKETHFQRFSNGTSLAIISYTLNKTFTADNTSVTRDQYRHFVDLGDGDVAQAYFDCHFTGNQTITIPASLSIVAPTYNCKACQYFESYKKTFDSEVGDGIEDRTNTIGGYIREIISLNIEIWKIIFYIALVVLLLGVIGLIFTAIYWIYLFIKGLVGGIK